ncbi:glutathione S-transferase family protein [Rhizobium sp. L1K21]|uniref:glutathione S-transferase family protein n=1 Tax=Rhizobium sp. L1K21 TaxID=2954933 RepID=UPI002092368A|nr:glutathione S-transferase family protein [Rhizobium sp. L1K21]MCO6187457.1 glutathione S-transferase family protein [Rhizobium sp. L1K21]
MIILHHCPQTRSMRSLWLLNELGVEFTTVVHPFGKNLRDPSYLKLSPAGRVPALEIDGERLFETGAITEYLCERFPEAGLGRLPGDPERAQWLMWVHFSETISQHIAALTQQHIMLYDDTMRSPVVMKLEAARLRKCYEAVETRLGETGDYLLKSGFSAVDTSVGHAVYMGLHFAKLEGLPRTEAWYARITERAAFKASLPKGEEEMLYRQAFYPAWERPAS